MDEVQHSISERKLEFRATGARGMGTQSLSSCFDLGQKVTFSGFFSSFFLIKGQKVPFSVFFFFLFNKGILKQQRAKLPFSEFLKSQPSTLLGEKFKMAVHINPSFFTLAPFFESWFGTSGIKRSSILSLKTAVEEVIQSHNAIKKRYVRANPFQE